MQTISKKIQNLAEAALFMGRSALIIAEDGDNTSFMPQAAAEALEKLGFLECHDYLEVMDELESGKEKVFYREKGERLNSQIFEIAAEFEAGVIGLADRKGNTGLKTARWNPANSALILIMSRTQVEKSHPNLFKYISVINTL